MAEDYSGYDVGPGNVGVAQAAGSGAGIGAMIAGPPGAIAGGLLGLAGRGITAWLNYKQAEEAKEEARERYEERLRRDQERWDYQVDQDAKRLKMDKMAYLEKLRQNKENMDNYYDERNYQRHNDLYNKTMKLLNTEGLRNKYLETWGR